MPTTERSSSVSVPLSLFVTHDKNKSRHRGTKARRRVRDVGPKKVQVDVVPSSCSTDDKTWQQNFPPLADTMTNPKIQKSVVSDALPSCGDNDEAAVHGRDDGGHVSNATCFFGLSDLNNGLYTQMTFSNPELQPGTCIHIKDDLSYFSQNSLMEFSAWAALVNRAPSAVNLDDGHVYQLGEHVRGRLSHRLDVCHEDMKFFLFYCPPSCYIQVQAASHLFWCGWRYHKIHQLWLKSYVNNEVTALGVRGSFLMFDHMHWKTQDIQGFVNFKDVQNIDPLLAVLTSTHK